MPKIIDVFPEWFTRGIFTRLGTLFPDELPWANENGQTLDQMYFGNHSGDKETAPLLDKFIAQNGENAISEEQVTTLANILYTRYGVQWGKLYNVLSAEYNPIENYSMVEEETPDLLTTETPNIHSTDTTRVSVDTETNVSNVIGNRVYGFNSDVAVPQGDTQAGGDTHVTGNPDSNFSLSDKTETGQRTFSETGKRTLTRSGNIGVTTSQQMLESEIKLWEWNFYETVFKDVDTVLTVPKYNFYYRRFLHYD